MGRSSLLRSRISNISPTSSYPLFGVKVTDEATCYKAFRTDILKRLDIRAKGFDFCPEATAKVLSTIHRFSGSPALRFKEVPISYHPRRRKEGKKLSYWRDGVIALFTLLKWRVML